MENEVSEEIKSVTFTETINSLVNGTINPKSISRKMRLECIAYFDEHGLSTREIGDIFKITDRHVRRLLSALSRPYLQEMNEKWVLGLFGEFYRYFRQQHKRALKMSWDENSSCTERLRALYLSWRLYNEFLQTIVSLGLKKGYYNPLQMHIDKPKIEIEQPNSEPEKDALRKLVAELLKQVPETIRENFIKKLNTEPDSLN
jgi:hypothetical protein